MGFRVCRALCDFNGALGFWVSVGSVWFYKFLGAPRDPSAVLSYGVHATLYQGLPTVTYTIYEQAPQRKYAAATTAKQCFAKLCTVGQTSSAPQDGLFTPDIFSGWDIDQPAGPACLRGTGK